MSDATLKSLLELSGLIHRREISIVELVRAYLDKIAKYDSGTGGLNSVLEINGKALDIARRMDEHPAAAGSAGVLRGMPILLKDNIDTGDTMHTSAGSLALSDNRAPRDADVAARLRACGAIILGKTNMTEFANRMTQGMPGGFSSRGGQVRSAYDRRQDPWGSSTGSAVAVSAGFCAAALGTDTSNSIVAAALRNGVAGFRPPVHALSQNGVIPISFTLDSIGPITRNMGDLTAFYSELSGHPMPDFSSETLAGKRLAVNIWNRDSLSQEINQSIDLVLSHLGAAGAVVETVSLPATTNLKQIMKYEFKYAMNRYLRTAGSSMKSLADIIAFNEQHAGQALRHGQSCLIDAQNNTTGRLIDDEYLSVMADRKRQIEAIRQVLAGYDACLMCSPNNVAHYTGLPSIALPNGLAADGMPAGLIMTGLDEIRLLAVACLMEEVCLKTPPPELCESVRVTLDKLDSQPIRIHNHVDKQRFTNENLC